MAIEKKFVYYRGQANFDTALDAGDISNDSIVFIEDSQRIWTHGTYFSSVKELVESIAAKQDILSAGTGIDITDNVVKCTLDTTVFVIVSALPDSPEEGNENKIHCVLKEVPADGDNYDEYYWANGTWEYLCSFHSDFDLNDYYTKTEVDSLISDAEEAATTAVNEAKEALEEEIAAIQASLDGKQDKLTAGDNIDITDNTISADLSDYYTKEEVDEAVSKKQDALTAGDNISIATDGTISATDTDTKNTAGATESSDKLFLIGAAEQGDNPVTNSSSAYVEDGTVYNGEGEALATEASVEAVSDEVTKVNETIAELLEEITPLTTTYCFMARTSGDADPAAQTFYGKQENVVNVARHFRMAAVRGQNDFDWLASCRITKGADGSAISIDGSDGDIMVATDTTIYLYAELIEATDGTLEIFGIGLVPVTLFGKSAVAYKPFAMACDAAVYAQLTSSNTDHIAINDSVSQLHCIYNTNIAGQYNAPTAYFTSTYKANGNGYPNSDYTTLNEILHAQNKNADTTTNYPYLGLYYRFVEIWMAAAKCEFGTNDISSADRLGVGSSSSITPTASTFADEAISGNSGIKIMDSSGSVVAYSNLYTQNIKLTSSSSADYTHLGLTGTTYGCDTLQCMTPHRIVDNVIAAGNLGYINNISNVFNEDGSLASGIDVSTGSGMTDGTRYYVIRDCDGVESFSDGVMTGVVVCYFKMTFASGVCYSDGTSLAGGTAIFKYALPLYRGFTWSTGHWIWMQGLHWVIHTESDGSTRYVTALYQRDPSLIPAWNGGTYYCVEADGDTDYEKGYEATTEQLAYFSFWAKNCNPSISMFYYPSSGGAQHTYMCAYTWKNYSLSGNLNAGYKSVNASAFGGSSNFANASACSLLGSGSVAHSGRNSAASFSLLDLGV